MSGWTVDQYETICTMIAKGVTSLELGNGEKVQYASLADLMKVKAEMERALGLFGGGRRHYPAFRKG